jgi:hypothetical protein
VPGSGVAGKGAVEFILVKETLGRTNPLLLDSSSSNEAGLMFVGLSPIFIWALAVNCSNSTPTKIDSLAFMRQQLMRQQLMCAI